MEIEELEKDDAKDRISSSRLIKTGTLSDEPGVIIKVLEPIGKLIGIREKDETVK